VTTFEYPTNLKLAGIRWFHLRSNQASQINMEANYTKAKALTRYAHTCTSIKHVSTIASP
jgi:hypothetical protein